MFGHKVRIPPEIKYGSRTCHPYQMVSSYGEYVTNMRERMQEAHNLARKYLGTVAKRQKENYDVKATTIKYQVVVVVNHCFTSLFGTKGLLSDIIIR